MKSVYIVSERNSSRKNMEQGNVIMESYAAPGWRREGHFCRGGGGGSEKAAVS